MNVCDFLQKKSKFGNPTYSKTRGNRGGYFRGYVFYWKLRGKWEYVYDFLRKKANSEIRPTAKQEEIEEANFADMPSTGI